MKCCDALDKIDDIEVQLTDLKNELVCLKEEIRSHIDVTQLLTDLTIEKVNRIIFLLYYYVLCEKNY